ncbi:MAG: radical SAM protein [Candidatus Eremiobacteraeota bacterium]|nr:radical SAM protein [Candidatus Eremiobacteraeota bacterium]
MEKSSNQPVREWIKSHRLRFPGYGVWLIGNEPNTAPPDQWEGAALRVLVFRLSPYHTTSTSMTQGLLGQIASGIAGTYVDYGFMPPSMEAGQLIRRSMPPLFGTTSGRPFSDFHVIAFSNSVAQELVNLPWLLGNSRIPLDFQQRMAMKAMPLLVMGGANGQSAFAACGDPRHSMVDALFFGEAEKYFAGMLSLIKEGLLEGAPKPEILKSLQQQIPAVYTAAGGSAGRERSLCSSLEGVEPLVKNPLWYDEESLGTGSLAIDAGCPHLCAFCKEAWEARPYRMRPVEEIAAALEQAKRFQGLDSVNIHSFNVTSHRDILAICRKAGEALARVLVKSQRFDYAARHPELIEAQRALGKNNFTFGLEGISARLRAFLAKNISEAQALRALASLYEGPVRQVKLFLILTGFEEERDYLEFHSFLVRVRDLRSRHRGSGKSPFVLSLTPLISMPHTPMQFNPFPGIGALSESTRKLVLLGESMGMVVRESITPREAHMAQLLLFADSTKASALIEASGKGFYGKEITHAIYKAFVDALPAPWKLWAEGEKTSRDSFPWDCIGAGAGKEALYRAYLALKEKLNEPGPPDAVRSSPPSRGTLIREKEKSQKTIWFTVESGRELAGVPLRFFQVALARALMLGCDSLAAFYREPGPPLDEPLFPLWGTRHFSLIFHDAPACDLQGGIARIAPQWAWSVKGHYREGPEALPGGFILELAMEGFINEHYARQFSTMLTSLGLQHSIRKRGDARVYLFSGKASGRTGISHVLFDYRRQVLHCAVRYRGGCEKIFERSGIRSLWEKNAIAPPRIVAWWRESESLRCGECGKPLWVDALSGEPVSSHPCGSAGRP